MNNGYGFHTSLEMERVTTLSSLRRADQRDVDAVDADYQSRMRVKLERIDQALLRMQSGHFGLCQTCGHMIDPERLAAMPYAETCFNCQRQLERRALRRYHPTRCYQ